MPSARFYVGMGPDAELVGSASHGGSIWSMAQLGIFGPVEVGDYTETTFRTVAVRATTDVPVPSPDTIYVFKNGSVLVYERGFADNGDSGYFQVALHYPNGARKPVVFPGVS